MALTTDQLAYLRSEVGAATPPTDDDLNAAFDRLGTPEAVALEIQRTRLAGFLADPATFSVEGYSQSTAANITALQAQIARLSGGVVGEGGAPMMTVAYLQRTSPGR